MPPLTATAPALEHLYSNATASPSSLDKQLNQLQEK